MFFFSFHSRKFESIFKYWGVFFVLVWFCFFSLLFSIFILMVCALLSLGLLFGFGAF